MFKSREIMGGVAGGMVLFALACSLAPVPLRLDADMISTVKMTEVPAPVVRPEWTSYTNADSIQALVFDNEGMLWSASTGGVVRWDLTDQSFTKFTTEHGLGSNNVSSLAVGADGSIWAGTGDGLSHFDGQSWRNFVPEEETVPFEITSVAVDTRGQVWVAGDYRVWRFAEGQWQQYTKEDGIKTAVYSVLARVNGDICAGSGIDLYCFHEERWTVLSEYQGQPIGDLYALAEGPNGVLWGVTDNGVASFDGEAWTFYEEEGFPDSMRAASLWIDSDNRVWVGTSLHDLAVFDGQKWDFPFKTTQISYSEEVTAMIVGEDGKLWLGVKKGGIYHFAGDDWKERRLDNAAWERYSSQGTPDFSENVEPVAAPDGSVWVADNYNLWHFEDDQWTVQREPAGARIMLTSAPAFAPDGSMWIGTMRSGVFNFDGKRWQQYTQKDGLLSNDWVSEVAVTGDGTAWFGTTPLIKEKIGGLSRFDGQRWATYPGIGNGWDRSVLAADPDGSVWVGTEEGLSHYVDGKWVNYTDLDGLPDNGIYSLAVSQDGILWVGCSTGLARFDGKRWQTYTFSMYEGTLVGSITALAVEENGAVWAAVYPFGVRRFDGRQWTVYTSRDGLGDDAVRHIAVTSDGSVWFSATGGLTRYQPAAGKP